MKPSEIEKAVLELHPKQGGDVISLDTTYETIGQQSLVVYQGKHYSYSTHRVRGDVIHLIFTEVNPPLILA